MPRRPIPLRNIGIRLINPSRRLSYLVTSQSPGTAAGGITWLSCQIGKERDPERPTEPVQTEFIQVTAVTLVRNPQFTPFTSPCDRFK
jgi:hypothetical protein